VTSFCRGFRKNFVLKKVPTAFQSFYLLLGVFLSWEIFFVSGVEARTKENIRVLVLQEVNQLKVTGQEIALKDLQTGRTFFKNIKVSSVIIEREIGSGLRIHGHSISAQTFLLTSARGPLTINGRRYRGKLKVFPGPNKDLWAINELPLEDYLAGLINCEISSQWPIEAVKAQAVAARTYAVFQKRNRQDKQYDVESSVADQVYAGIGPEDDRSRKAVKETEGELLLYQGHPIFSVYHACCGGKTELPEYLWAGFFPYLKSVDCAYCLDSPYFLWNYQAHPETLGKTLLSLGFTGSRVLEIQVAERSDSRRVLRLFIKDDKHRLDVPGKEFRRLLGYDLLRSTNFWVKEDDRGFFFSGLGWGHGVGLCQWGAKGMAEAGADYRSILKHFYQNIEIGKFPR